MRKIPSEQILSYRDAVRKGPQGDMVLDVGYFLVWFSAAELGITALLALASSARDLNDFDILVSGMDCRVKIERLRKLRKRHGGLGPNLSKRLAYIDDKARPIRNRLAHSFLSNSEKGPPRYFASSMGSLPWKELDGTPPLRGSLPPVIITPDQLLGWGAWFALFTEDVTHAFNHAIQTGEYEIVNPQTQVPSADQESPDLPEHPATGDNSGQTPPK